MSKNKDILVSGASTILHSIIIPVFALVFTIAYKPFGTYELLQIGQTSFSFNVTICFCIIAISIILTRPWLYILGRYKKIVRPVYAIWCLGEVVIASLFVSLYIALMMHRAVPFFEVAGTSFAMLAGISIFPYAILWSGLELYAKNKESEEIPDDNSLIRFYDEYKKLRLVIAPEAVMFIKSEENYVQIHYIDAGRTKKFVLRSSMRALEETLAKRGLVRCHRSYFINPEYIKIIHRDSSGLIVAELKQDGFESIPISKKYHEEITRLL